MFLKADKFDFLATFVCFIGAMSRTSQEKYITYLKTLSLVVAANLSEAKDTHGHQWVAAGLLL